ncbi:MAG: AI-2E family transporter, partial [Anaerolineales bacterium]|nr:AI-2E family transporter [Anaerolineales bacterium]
MKQYTWSRPTRLTMLALLIALGIWFAYYARDLISALLLGALIAFILNPFLLRIEQRTRWPRSLTVPLVFLLFLIVFVGGIILLVPYLLRELNDLALELQNIQARLENTLADRTFSFLFLELRPRDVVEMLRGSTSDLLQPDRAFRFM